MLYIHIPFCHSKCVYCDFYSTPLGRKLYDDYLTALLTETSRRLGELPAPPSSIYIGGGTPSILSEQLTLRLLEGLLSMVDISRVKEWTIEMNPEDVNPRILQLYREHGVNRISMGIQSFHDNTLKKIGRRHTARQALTAVSMIQNAGFRHSFDLIYGLPDEGMEQWSESLYKLMDFHPDHFSAYLLSYEPGTALYRMMTAGRVTEASEQLVTGMYSHLCQVSADNGFEHYEISNFAGKGGKSLHNSRYWNGTPYLGVGCSAHSFTNGLRKWNPPDVKAYIETINNHDSLPFQIEEETTSEKFNDLIITTLRTNKGFDLSLVDGFPEPIRREFAKNIEPELKSGSLLLADNHLIIPEDKWLRADSVMRNLIVETDN